VSARDLGMGNVAGSTSAKVAGARLLSLPGIGPWTVAYVQARALGDPDTFLPTDLGVRRALRCVDQRAGAGAAHELAQRWRPWRSYALHHLWASLDAPVPTEVSK